MLQQFSKNRNNFFKRKNKKVNFYEGGAHFKYEDLYNILYKLKNKNYFKLNLSKSFLNKHKNFINESININNNNEENKMINYNNNYNDINLLILNEINKYKKKNYNYQLVRNLKRNQLDNVLKNKKFIDNLNISNEKYLVNGNYSQLKENNLKIKLPKIRINYFENNNKIKKNNSFINTKALNEFNNKFNYFSNQNNLNFNDIFFNQNLNFPVLNLNKKSDLLNKIKKKNSVISFEQLKNNLKKNNSFCSN